VKTIYLLRHGEIPGHSPRRMVGQTELALTGRGREQMRWTAGRLKDAGIDRLVASPLGRCRESAGILGAVLGLSPEIEPALREIAMGAWEGMTVTEIRRHFPGSYEARGKDIAIFRPPAGESFVDLSDRVWPVFLEILQGPAENIAIVGHAGVNRVLLCRLLGMPLSLLFRLRQDYACINVIRWRDEGFELELLNGSQATLDSLSGTNPFE
jgi:probable phosphoglycerate mutase